MSHILGNTEVFVNAGASVWAWLYFQRPTPIDGIYFLSWQPLAFWTEGGPPFNAAEFSWATVRSHVEGETCYFEKLITNTGPADASFLYYYEFVP